MKRTLPSLLALSLGIMLCAGKCSDKTDPAADMTAIGEGKWMLQTLDGKDVQMPEGVDNPYLSLDPKAGTISGFGGCNRLMGSVKVDGGTIAFTQIGSTKMYCEGTQQTENQFKAALSAATAYKLNGDNLTLLNAGKEVATLLHAK